MKILLVLFIFAIYCIDAVPPCSSKSCNGCLASNNCVWCDNRCASKNAFISCESRITTPTGCNSERQGCEYNGKTYSEGESFKVDCNTCSCNNGLVACTLMACLGCEAVQCEEGNTCFVENGVATCKPSCAVLDCGDQKSCYVDNEGNAHCCTDPCMTVRCGSERSLCITTQDCTAACVKSECDYNGHTHYHGESFPSDDGCNSCSCYNGTVACTLRFCVQTCEYGGQTYNEGDSFTATDGCNTCHCVSGQAACTKIACPPNPVTCETCSDCDSTSYCAKAKCEDIKGTCTKRPELCTAIYDPVCSCDNNTRGSACSAASAGENVKSKGECPKY